MRTLILFLVLALCSCGQQPTSPQDKPDPAAELKREREIYEAIIKRREAFMMDTVARSMYADTINLTDLNGLKQGFWKNFDTAKQISDRIPMQVLSEGYYVNGKKWGIWREYTPKGELKSKIRYESDKEVEN